MNSEVLVESPTFRAQHVSRVEVLDKVGALALLPDGVHTDRAGVASFYGTPEETIKSVIRNHRLELEGNGMRVIAGQEFRSIVDPNPRPGRPSATIFPRRAVLNVGMLLTGSETARQVRAYLLNVEEATPVEDREAAVLRLLQKRQYKEVVRDTLKSIGTEPGWQYGQIHNVLLEGITGMRAPEILASGREIQTWPKEKPRKTDYDVATNFLFADELELFNLITDAVAVDLRFTKPTTYRGFLAVVRATTERYTGR